MARLIFVGGPMTGGVVEIDASDLELGREVEGGLVLHGDAGVSRRHAKLFRQGGSTSLVDLGSRNGTTVNGRPVGGAPVGLRPGDTIQIGNHVMRFEDAGAPMTGNATQAFVPQAPLVAPPEPLTGPRFVAAPGSPYGNAPGAGTVPARGGLAWLWPLLLLAALAPCALLIVGRIAPALLPFAAIVGGLALATLGFFDYRRFSPYPQWVEATRSAMVKLVVGLALLVLGGLWLAHVWTTPHRPFPRSRFGRNR